jgi:two-component sensor histidine kinase
MLWSASFAQQYTHYTTKEGLPSNNIYRITQDSKGFIWFVTDKGMVKYNGTDFKVFTTRQGLPTNDIWAIQATPDNKVWFFSKAPKLGYIVNDSVHSFESINKGEILNPINYNVVGNTVHLINYKTTCFLNNDNYWEPLKIYTDTTTASWSVFNHKYIKQINLKKRNDSISITNNKDKVVRSYKIPDVFKSIVTRGQVNDSLYCWINKYGYVFLNLNTLQFISKKFEDEIQEKEIDYPRFTVANGQIQLTGKGFVAILDKNYHLKNKVIIPKKLESYFSFIDRTGNVWIASLTKGVYKLPQSKINGIYCLNNEKIFNINKVGNLLISSVFNKGFYRYDSINKVFIPFLKEKGFMYKGIQIDSLKKQFYLTNTKIIQFSNGKKSVIDFAKRKQKANETARQLVYYKGFLYGSYSFGLSKINPEKLNVVKKYVQVGIGTIVNFRDQLIFASSNGIKTLKNDSIQPVLIQNINFNKPILKLKKISESKLIVGTDGFGAYLTDLKTITLLPKSEFLSVQDAFIDDEDIWLATELGIWHYKKFNHKYKLVKHYTTEDGLPASKINSIYIFNNSMIIGSDNGAATIPVNNLQTTQLIDIYFENSEYNSTKFDAKKSSFSYTYANNVTFTISTIDFSETTQEFKYQYKLDPLQKSWISTTSKHLNFTDLPPNKYNLLIKAQNIQKNNNFIITPLWWQRPIAKIGFILLFLSGIGLFLFVIRKRELDKRTAKINAQKKMAEYELYALRSQMNPHFVFNSLNAIQYYLTNNEIELSEKYLVKFSKLIRMFFEFSRNEVIDIKEEIQLLNGYLEIEKLRFGKDFNYKITIDEKLDNERQIPAMLLQPIVENAVNHGLFHKQGAGLVSILFQKINDRIYQVIIEDNGIGRKKSNQIKQRSLRKHQSKSTQILHDRILLLNQSKKWNITYNITDLDKDNKQGTRVSLKFKQL